MLTASLLVIGILLASFVIFMNGVLFAITGDNNDDDGSEIPFYLRWIKILNEDQDTKSGKILMASFYFIVSGFAICSFLSSLVQAKKEKEL